MEALLFLIDGLAFVLVVYMGLRDDRRPPGAPMTSFFRMTEDGTRVVDEAAAEIARRIARSRM